MGRIVAAALAAALSFPALAGAQEVSEQDLSRASGDWAVQVGSPSTGRVVTLPIEVYVARVLAGEGVASAPDAAQEALAVAIRTFAAANVGRHAAEGYELCDETHCQVLRDSTDVSRRAAMATAGTVLLYEGHPAELFYSASCGGRTERAADVWSGVDFPYLQSRVDDVHEDDVPWTADFSLQEIQRALQRAGFAGARLRGVRVESRTVSERVNRLRIDGMRPAVISGEQFRTALGSTVLRSTAFTIEERGRELHFTGRGYGHGVGMCVIGAGRRAARGETYDEILAQYYPGLALVSAGSAPVVPVAAPAPAAPAAAPAVSARVPALSAVGQDELEAMAARAGDELSAALGVAGLPGGLRVQLHESLDGFWMATGQPWWTGSVTRGTAIDLAPVTVLAERDGVEMTVRAAVARILVSGALAGRPAWVRVGAARYYARASLGLPPVSGASPECPSDAELTLAISAAALRDAEARAEACFVDGLTRAGGDWRAVR